jgi:hypothetical protein
MADAKSLRTIGFAFSAITLAVTFVAMLLVADAIQAAQETMSLVASATR